MDIKQLRAIFDSNSLPEPESFAKVAVGFSNKVYSVDDKYILKVCGDESDEEPFEREATLYRFYQGVLPVPKVRVYDDSKSLLEYSYMIYDKIQGENLYNIWHRLTVEQRRSIVKQLCDALRLIAETNLKSLPSGVNLTPIPSWKDHIIQRLNSHLSSCLKDEIISYDLAQRIEAYVDKHEHVLNEQREALVYSDAHFDNVLVDEDEMVGLIDFERTTLASIDFMLDIVMRMVKHPKKYMSEYAEQFARNEDYADLLDWYREYYPELFAFKGLDLRLNIYAIEHNLADLNNWPQVAELKDEIEAIISG